MDAAALISRNGPELSAVELYALLRLRSEVFVVEQECPYLDPDGRDLEAGTTHLWTGDGDGVVAAIRVLSESDGRRRIGRVVTRTDRRGEGWSSFLLEAALGRIGHAPTVLDAQAHLRTFYERFGYVVAGAGFLEDGIPHLPMERPGNPGGPGSP